MILMTGLSCVMLLQTGEKRNFAVSKSERVKE